MLYFVQEEMLAILSLVAELIMIFASEIAVRYLHSLPLIKLIQFVVILASVFFCHFPYILCFYLVVLFYRLILKDTEPTNGLYHGYTVSKPLTSIFVEEDPEAFYDSPRRTQGNHVTHGLRQSHNASLLVRNSITPRDQQPLRRPTTESVRNEPTKLEPRREGLTKVEPRRGLEPRRGVVPGKAQFIQKLISPVMSSSTPSPSPSSTPSPSPPGLTNLGNTCFTNAVVQCLVWMPGFTELLRAERGKMASLGSLLEVTEQCHNAPSWPKQKAVNTAPLLQALSGVAPHLVKQPKGAASQGQQDAAEFLMWLLDHLHTILVKQETCGGGDVCMAELGRIHQAKTEELSKARSPDLSSYQDCLKVLSETDLELHMKKNWSSIYDHFLGQVAEARECQHCKKMSVNFEYFTIFPLPVMTSSCGNTRSLNDCFSLFAEEESLDRANMFRCPCRLGTECSYVTGKRIALISHLPRNLILVLKRFSYDANRGCVAKSNSPISVPATLNLQPYTLCERLRASVHQLTYELQAFCVHTGAQSTAYGHYIAYSRVSNPSFPSTSTTPSVVSNSSQWFCFNDTSVAAITDIATELRSRLVLENAYLLFYTAN